jgi:cysteine desulfurase/selenocysteine lyase
MDEPLVYLDNAATSFPKPRTVLERMVERYARSGVSPGRGGYDLAVEASGMVDSARRQLAEFFDAPDPDRVVFGANATDALNLAIQGMVRPGDHVVSTRLEHNSVLRPLSHLRARGWIDFDLVPFDGRGLVDPEDVGRAIRNTTTLVVVCHASQVLGTTQPVAQIARVCAERGVPLLVDAAQSAGQVPVQLSDWGAGAIAFTGHKALCGPAGIGGLVLAPETRIASTRFGGTGYDSGDLMQPQTFPYRLEAGTCNLLGVIGLSEGLAYLGSQDVAASHAREMTMIRRLRAGLIDLSIHVQSPEPRDEDVPLLSCTVDGIEPHDVGAILDADYGIAVRTGLLCAPLVHHDLHDAEEGSIRFSLGLSTTDDDIDRALAAMATISARGRRRRSF